MEYHKSRYAQYIFKEKLEKNIQSLTNIMIILRQWEANLAMFQLQIAKCA